MAFQVVFTGCARDGIDRREGIKQLSERFKLNFTQINRLLISGRSVIKKVEDRSSGERLLLKLWESGWHAELISGRDVIVETLGWTDAPATSSSNAKEHVCEENVDGPEEIVVTGMGCSAVVPAGWSALEDLNSGAVLQAGDLNSNQFLVVLRQKLTEISPNTDLSDYCSAQLAQCAERVPKADIAAPAKSVGRGDAAGEYGEVTAEVGGVAVHYLIACVNSGGCIYTLFLWCERKDFQALRDVFLGIVSGLSVDKSPGEKSPVASAHNLQAEDVET
ncbi:hypothetical protein [Microbulbifer aggregans]|uniref:hypothetical protein n=1 Tax=Microbulbifer aggregans TaxID=1769779 RepID=UPI001CFC8237|nr:hypothetical protein [Microbulbifer aggregans]